VQNVKNKPEEAMKQEICDIFEELNYKMEIKWIFSGYIKALLYPPEVLKSNQTHSALFSYEF
jgi:hypothetical protein